MTVPIRTGLAAQMGFAEETVYGTYVAPARFMEFVDESMTQDVERLESAGLRAGVRVLPSSRWMAGQKTVAGDLSLEMLTTGLGLLFEHAFGGLVTTNPMGTAFEHTFTPGDLPTGGLSIQIGKPDVSAAGVVHPFTYLGARIANFGIKGTVGEIGEVTLGIIAQDEDTTETLGAATYPANSLLTFVDASLLIATASVPVRSAEFNGDNGLVDGRGVLGTDLMEEPIEGSPMRTYDGTIDAHFTSLTEYNRFVNGTEALLDLDFQGVDIETALPFAIEIQANIRFDGETPKVSGPDELVQNLPFKVVDESQLELVYRTTDALP